MCRVGSARVEFQLGAGEFPRRNYERERGMGVGEPLVELGARARRLRAPIVVAAGDDRPVAISAKQSAAGVREPCRIGGDRPFEERERLAPAIRIRCSRSSGP